MGVYSVKLVVCIDVPNIKKSNFSVLYQALEITAQRNYVIPVSAILKKGIKEI